MAFQGDSIYWVEVEKIVPNPFQPRREFDENKLQELAESIRMYGVLQPLTVTRKEVQREDGTFYSEYELIAGERRLRASKLAQVAQVPVIIREGEQTEQEKLELAIIENLQREDLNAVDRAIAFKQLAVQFKLSHAQVAKKVGRSREYVSNSIRLLGLPEQIQHSLKVGDIMEGHARTLLMLNDKPVEQDVIYREILLKKLSVREVERIVRKIAADRVRKKKEEEFDPGLIEFEKKFTETLGTRVQIQKTEFGGKLTIDYFSVDDLENILERMKEEASMSSGPVAANAVAGISEATPLVLDEVSDNSEIELSDSVISDQVQPAPAKNESTEVAEDNSQEDEVVDNKIEHSRKDDVVGVATSFSMMDEKESEEVVTQDVVHNASQSENETMNQPQPVSEFFADLTKEKKQDGLASEEGVSHGGSDNIIPTQTSPLDNSIPAEKTPQDSNSESEFSTVQEEAAVDVDMNNKEDDSDLYSINSFRI